MNTTETRKVSMKELAKAFEGKYINASSPDHYNMAVSLHRGTIEYENDLMSELFLVFRDDKNHVTGSIAINEDAVDSIEEYNGTYRISFNIDMGDIDISEYKSLEELQKEHDERQKV